ncbi:hypothetical protein [Halodesulfovibrio aestuarii]|uniref:AAA family ATPase n=1 Tax=Halodesulfovibrio aestuarii TaxID=126333 RepID=A0ABV4JMY3_9BACT
MEITINNCNSLDSAKLTIASQKLNIKFAPNGTGKSTIGQAIQYAAQKNDSKLLDLLPFKYRDSNPEGIAPSVSELGEIKEVMCFNENYVNQFVFQQDELLNNSFEIFIKNEFYKEKEKEIEDSVGGIKKLFTNNDELNSFIANLKELNSAFKLTKKGISKTSTGIKALNSGNKRHNIPEKLKSYAPLIKSQQCVDWIAWQTKGCSFSEVTTSCPFCSTEKAQELDHVQQVGREYDKTIVRNLIKITGALEVLGDYFVAETKDRLQKIATKKDGLDDTDEYILTDVKKQIELLVNQLERLKSLSSLTFSKEDNINDKLEKFKIKLDDLKRISSPKTKSATDKINTSITDVQQKAGVLQGAIRLQQLQSEKLIEKHQNNINEFLAYAGFKYKVELTGNKGQSQLKLKHVDHKEYLAGGNQHLSFGERNAFAIVLFMYECLAKKTDLIILDDPISSFDKNKKYAILQMLFRRDSEECLKSKTVLMLTHDIEPIIDTVKSLQEFNGQTTNSFLKLNRGNLTELNITKDDIQTFPEICKNICTSEKHDVIKAIYLRRYYETIGQKNYSYQILSNLLHKRDKVTDQSKEQVAGEYPAMPVAEFKHGFDSIKQWIENFDYPQLLAKIKNTATLCQFYDACETGYEKLQIFRLLSGTDQEHPTIRKFINETYHIENEFICQLAPDKFDTIPEYVILKCDEIVAAIAKDLPHPEVAV